jgi:hypothetical protein
MNCANVTLHRHVWAQMVPTRRPSCRRGPAMSPRDGGLPKAELKERHAPSSVVTYRDDQQERDARRRLTWR